MYTVLCFDQEDSSSVTLECLTSNLELANVRYQENVEQSNEGELVELIEIEKEFDGSFCFYWGEKVPGVNVLKSNNRN